MAVSASTNNFHSGLLQRRALHGVNKRQEQSVASITHSVQTIFRALPPDQQFQFKALASPSCLHSNVIQFQS